MLVVCGRLSSGHKWIVAGAFASASKKGYVVAGYASTLALFILVLTSLPFIRNRFYAVFKVCHFIGIFGFLIGLALHIKQAVPWVIASFVLYGVEQLLRVVKLRYVEASLVALQGADTTMITVDSVKSGWRAGQHVVLRVPGLASKVGPQAMEGHPFTIASAPDANGLVLMAKNVGAVSPARDGTG
jgi:predicted ferric reductase